VKLFGKQHSLSFLGASNKHISIAVSKHSLILSSFFPIQNRLKTRSLDNTTREFSFTYLDNSLYLARTLSVPKSEQFSESEVKLEENWVVITSKDKSLRVFSRQIEAIVFIILQMYFFSQHAKFWNLGHHKKIPQFILGIFSHVNAFRPIARERKYLMDYKEALYYATHSW